MKDFAAGFEAISEVFDSVSEMDKEEIIRLSGMPPQHASLVEFDARIETLRDSFSGWQDGFEKKLDHDEKTGEVLLYHLESVLILSSIRISFLLGSDVTMIRGEKRWELKRLADLQSWIRTKKYEVKRDFDSDVAIESDFLFVLLSNSPSA